MMIRPPTGHPFFRMLERMRRQTIEQQGVCHAGFCAVLSGQAAASVVMLRQNLSSVTKQNNRCPSGTRVETPSQDAVCAGEKWLRQLAVSCTYSDDRTTLRSRLVRVNKQAANKGLPHIPVQQQRQFRWHVRAAFTSWPSEPQKRQQVIEPGQGCVSGAPYPMRHQPPFCLLAPQPSGPEGKPGAIK
ncbi:hypothetical protein [Polaromonas glacialis]|uniref:hypothetical protein n=1 Tax=Polaromonas glacialis TaxID=866564 RepID=UPI0012EB9F4C|nr:hypothetical protein [Polaromonas glacialis]